MLLEVDPDTLGNTASQLSAAMDIANDIVSRTNSLVGNTGAAGRSDVTSAIETFATTWSYGLNNMNKDAQTLAKLLGATAAKYDAQESAIAKAAT